MASITKQDIATALGTDTTTLDAIFSATNSKRAILVNEQNGIKGKMNAVRADRDQRNVETEQQLTELQNAYNDLQGQIDALADK